MKTLVLAALLLPQFAAAAELTYKTDIENSKMDSITAFDICGLPEEIKMDSRADLPTLVIQARATDPRQLKIQTIQASRGSIQEGAEEPYTGEYRERVALVQLLAYAPYYKGGVFERVQVTTYGSTAAPKAFVVDVELLNYRESAELAEGSICTGYAYRLAKK